MRFIHHNSKQNFIRLVFGKIIVDVTLEIFYKHLRARSQRRRITVLSKSLYWNKIIKIKQVNLTDKVQQPFPPNDQKQIGHNILGVEKGDKGRYEDAFTEFIRAIELNPKDADAYFNLATLKVHFGDIKGASADFKMSEKCHRDSGFKFLNYPLI